MLRRWVPSCKHLPCSPHRDREGDVLATSLSDAVQVSALSMTTTAIAFGASINSPISTIRQYALFQTICVVVEYGLILSLLVPGMVFFRRRIFEVRHAKPVDFFKDTTTRLERARSGVKMVLLPIRVVLWPSMPTFWRKIVLRLTGPRDLILLCLVWLAIVGVQAAQAVQLEPTSSAPTLFAKDHNMVRRPFIELHAFGAQAVSLANAATAMARIAGSAEAQEWLRSPGGQECLATCNVGNLASGTCDAGCNTAVCCYDGGDCGSCNMLDTLELSRRWGMETPIPAPPLTPPSPPAAPLPPLVPPPCIQASDPPPSHSPVASQPSTPLPPSSPVAPPAYRPPSPPAQPPSAPLAPCPPSPLLPASAPPMPPPPPRWPPVEPIAPLPPPEPPRIPMPPATPPALVCTPTRSNATSIECNAKGPCHEPGYCSCIDGYAGAQCQMAVDAEGNQLLIRAASSRAVIHFVWGIEPEPERNLLDGRPVGARLDAAQQEVLLDGGSQELMAELCERLELLPSWRAVDGTVECPMLALKRYRQAQGLAWPLPAAELLRRLRDLPATAFSSLVGIREDEHTGEQSIIWMAAKVDANTGAPLTPTDDH